MTRYTKVTVNDSSVVVPEKTLICGDVNGDFKIDASDVNRITEVFALTDNEYGGENFDICCDMDGDGIISPDDIDLANMNRGKDATFYNEGIEFFFQISGKVSPVVYFEGYDAINAMYGS